MTSATRPPTPPRDRPATVLVALPGTGSDADFAARVFGPACAAAGLALRAVDPDPRGVAASYRAALDAAAADGPVVVGGVSLGSLVGVGWALAHPGSVAGLALALVPWTGAPGGAPAALGARTGADALERDGLDAVLAGVAATAPAWLAAELDRAWRAQWPHLPAALREAAATAGPGTAALASLRAPLGLAACPDDPVHPAAVARAWARAVPRAALREVGLAAVGADPAALGTAALGALADAATRPG